MRKGLLTAALLAVTLSFSAVGCGGRTTPVDDHEYTITINNKEAMQAEWLSDDPSRTLDLTITKDGVEQNVTQAIQDEELTLVSSDTAVASVMGRNVTPVAEGTATITATYGNASDSVNITITYSDPHGKSADDPLTVAEAIAICQATGETSTTITYYVSGVVTSIGTAYDPKYGNITILIGDTKTSTNTVTCFRVVPEEGVDYSIIGPGSQVLVSGTLVNYQGKTPEINAGGKILSATQGDVAHEIEATVAEALAACMALAENTSSLDIYIITGYVVATNADGFYMSDTKGAITPTQDDFLVYGWKGSNLSEITVDAKVKVTATLKHYVSSTTTGKYAYETNTPTDVEILEAGQVEPDPTAATVAEALVVINALEDGATTTEKYAVTGVVVAVTYAWASGTMSFTMGDTPTDEALITVYKGAIDEAGKDDIVANARVTVTGYLQKYVKNSTVTPELTGGSIKYLGEYVPELTGIALDKETASVYIGSTVTLTASAVPAGAELGTVAWTSSDEAIATVDGGVVTGVAEGTATITATAGEFSASCVVTVAAAPIPATSVTLDKSTLALEIPGDTATLVATVLPAETTDKAVWTSDNEDVATVDKGVVTPVAAGTANITVKLNDSVSATCVVTVSAVHGTTEADPLTVSEAVTIGQSLSNNANTEIDYYIAGYVDEIVYAWSSGYGTFTNWITDGSKRFECYSVNATQALGETIELGSNILIKGQIKKYSSTIETVSKQANLISVDNSAYTFAAISGENSVVVGSSITLTATAYPVSLGAASFTWTSSNEAVATVADGVVTGVTAGNVTITATVGSLSATYSVDVTASATSTKEIVPAHNSFTWDDENDTGSLVSGDFTLSYDGASASTKQSSYTSTDQIRVYQNGVFTITADSSKVEKIVSVTFTTSSKNFSTSQTFTGGAFDGYTTAGTSAKVTCNDNVVELSFTAAAQVRLANISIVYIAK